MSDITPHIERNGGMANLYPSAYERELERALATANKQIEALETKRREHEGLLRLADAFGNAADWRAFKRMVRVYFGEDFDDLMPNENEQVA